MRLEKAIVAIVQVDNHDDVLKSTKEEKRMFVLAEIDRKISLWASRMNAVIKKYQTDTVCFGFTLYKSDKKQITFKAFSVLSNI